DAAGPAAHQRIRRHAVRRSAKQGFCRAGLSDPRLCRTARTADHVTDGPKPAYWLVRSLCFGRRPAGADLFAVSAAYVEAVCLHAARSAGTVLPGKLFALDAVLEASNLCAAAGQSTACDLRICLCEKRHHA